MATIDAPTVERSLRSAAAAGCVALLLGATEVEAAAWDFTPYAAIDLIHTDNVELAPDGEQESESVLHFVPGFKLKGKGPRLELDAQYELESYSYAEESDRNEFFHRLQVAGKATVMPENFYLGGTASIGQTIIDPTGQVPLSNLAVVANRTDTFTWTLNPYYEHRFAGDLLVHAGYSYGQIQYQRSDLNGVPLDDLTYRTIDGSVGRETEHDQFGWAVFYKRQSVGYEDAASYAYETAGARAQYSLSSTFALTARAGRESDVQTDQVTAQLDATFWSGGFIWHPSRTQELSVSAGKRFFGNTYSAEYKFTGRRLDVGASYEEGPTTQGIDAFKRPVFSGEPDQVGPQITPITPDVFVSKMARFWAQVNGRRNTIVLQAYDERREYIDDSQDESERNASGQWTYLIGPRTKAYIAVQWYTLGYRASERDDYFTTYSLGLSRQVGRHFSLHGSVQRWKRTTDDDSPAAAALSYTENAVTIGGRYEF